MRRHLACIALVTAFATSMIADTTDSLNDLVGVDFGPVVEPGG